MRPAAAKGLQVAGGSSKTRDASKHKSAASGIGENLLLENKNEGYDDALGKKSWFQEYDLQGNKVEEFRVDNIRKLVAIKGIALLLRFHLGSWNEHWLNNNHYHFGLWQKLLLMQSQNHDLFVANA